MRVALVQFDIDWEQPAANLARVEAMLDAATGAPGTPATGTLTPGTLVVLPEMFATGFTMDVSAAAQGPDREVEAFLADQARRRGVWMLGGVVTAGADGRGRNEAVAFDPAGRPAARYAKMHPFSYAGETRHYAPGEAVATFPCGEAVVAPLICYDLRFPEVFRLAVRRGATLLAVLANWPAVREGHWLALLRARAIENQAYVAGVNRVGRDPQNAYAGRSVVIGPQGDVVADAWNAAGVLVAELDLPALYRYRQAFPALADIRPDCLPPEH